MPSPRNSRFIENFDDESESSSPESLASAPSPEHMHDSSSSEGLMRMFSAMGLRETAPRASSQHQQVTATQSQTPTQTQAPDTPQDNGSSTVTAETSSERAGAGTDEHQESKPDVAKEESSAPTVEGDPDQNERHDTAQLASAKTANISLHQLFDEVLREQSITPEEMHHASKHIQTNLQRLERDLERFAEQRLLVSRSLQRWFIVHKHDSSWETTNPCQKCSMLFDKLDEIYLVACFNVRDMMTVLEKGLRASALLYKSNDRHVSGSTQDQTLGQYRAPLLKDLKSTERMLQSLYDDAEKRKGWPYLDLSGQRSSMNQQSQNELDQETRPESEQTKVKAGANSSAITSSQIHEVFGNTILPLAYFKRMRGRTDGQVSFAMDSYGDISAQQWSQSDEQWFCIGRFSRSRGCIEGILASHRLRNKLELHVHALPQNSLGYFKAVAKQHEARNMKLVFGPEELQACLTGVSVHRAAQEVISTSSATEAPTQSEPDSGDAETANGDQNFQIEVAKSNQAMSKKTSRRNRRRRRRADGRGAASGRQHHGQHTRQRT